jgi:hypothetical protein
MLRDWTDSNKIDSLSPQAEVFFTRLIMKVDDYGAFHAHPKLLNSALFPLKEYKADKMLQWLKECVENGLVKTYEQSGKPYLQILEFGQRLDRARAKFPTPKNDVQGFVYLFQSEHLYKIGYSANPWARVKEVKSPIDKPVVLTMTFKGTENEERQIHDTLRYCNYEGEWFELENHEISIFKAVYAEEGTASQLVVAQRNFRSKTAQPELEVETEVETEVESESETEEETKLNPKTVAVEPLVFVWPSFDDFWEAYGKKVDRPKCEKKWKKISQEAREKLMDHVPRYVESSPEIQYRKNPLTYLNGECWNDEIITNGKRNPKEDNLRSIAAGIARRFNAANGTGQATGSD